MWIAQYLGIPLGGCCLLGTRLTCAWPQQYWGCFVLLGGTRERPRNRNVLIRGLESASRWHARVLSSREESFETTKLSWVPQMTYSEQLLNMTLNIKISEEVMLARKKQKNPKLMNIFRKGFVWVIKKYISAIHRKLSSYYRYRLRILFVRTFWFAHLSLLQSYKNTLKTSALKKNRFKRNLTSERGLFHWCLSLYRRSNRNCISDHWKMDSCQRHQLSWQCDMMSCSLSLPDSATETA